MTLHSLSRLRSQFSARRGPSRAEPDNRPHFGELSDRPVGRPGGRRYNHGDDVESHPQVDEAESCCGGLPTGAKIGKLTTDGHSSSGPTFHRPSGAWHAVLFAFLLLVYVVVHILFVLPGLETKQSDFGTFYYPAARAVLADHSPYSVVGLVYPPLLPFILLPLALLPAAGARMIWFTLSHVFAAAAGVRMWRALGGGWCAALAIAGAWATSGALFEDLREGQVNSLLLLLVALSLWPMASRALQGPTAMGFAIALKLWPGVMILAELLRCRWRTVARACGMALIFVLLPWLFVAVFLPGPTAPPRADFWAGSPGALNGSLPGVALRLLDRPTRGAPVPRQWVAAHSVESFRLTRFQVAVSLGMALVLFGAGVAAIAWLDWRGGRSSPVPLVSAAFIALALVSAPVVWPHYHVLQLPGVGMLGERFLRRRHWRSLLALGAATVASTWPAAVILGPYLSHYGLIVTSPTLLWTLTSLTPLGGLAILLLLFAELKRAFEPQTRTPSISALQS